MRGCMYTFALKNFGRASSKLHLSIMPYYAVRKGRETGIYNTWGECKEQVDGVYAKFKKFSSLEEAQEFMNVADPPHAQRSRPFHASQKMPSSHGTRSGYGTSSNYGQTSSYGTSNNYNYEPTSSYGTSSSYATTSYGNKRKYEEEDSGGYNKRSKQENVADREVVYSDGCCFSNGRRGAKAGIGVFWGDGDPRNVSARLGGGPETNQRAELNAAIRAVEIAKDKNMKELEIRTDSMYTLNAATKWMDTWKHNGFRTAKGTDVKNKDDIMKLHKLCQQVDVKWTHVRGHQGHAGNEKADELAKRGAEL